MTIRPGKHCAWFLGGVDPASAGPQHRRTPWTPQVGRPPALLGELQGSSSCPASKASGHKCLPGPRIIFSKHLLWGGTANTCYLPTFWYAHDVCRAADPNAANKQKRKEACKDSSVDSGTPAGLWKEPGPCRAHCRAWLLCGCSGPGEVLLRDRIR